jgi:hypothetical protein
MVWVLFVIVFVSLLGGLYLGLFLRMKRSSARITAELRDEHGSDLKCVSGCGIVSGASRVPGVLALLRDRLVYRPLMFLTGGEIPLRRIVEFHSEETRSTRYGRARKYWNAQVLAFRTDSGEERIFVVRKTRVKEWEAALARARIRPGVG